jgi:transcriptional regulator with XRE-family HTH domain
MDYRTLIEQLIKRQPDVHGSICKVAALLGVDRSTLWRLRQGSQRPSWDTSERLLSLQDQALKAKRR